MKYKDEGWRMLYEDEGLRTEDEGWRTEDEGWSTKDEGWSVNKRESINTTVVGSKFSSQLI